jgi:hypothetical protein
MPLTELTHKDLDEWYDMGYIITVQTHEGDVIARLCEVI